MKHVSMINSRGKKQEETKVRYRAIPVRTTPDRHNKHHLLRIWAKGKACTQLAAMCISTAIAGNSRRPLHHLINYSMNNQL